MANALVLLVASAVVLPEVQVDWWQGLAVNDVVGLALNQERVQGDLLDAGVVAENAGNRRLSQLVQLVDREASVGIVAVLEPPTISVLPVSVSSGKNPC